MTIVEFTGVAGVGKTTLVKEVTRLLAERGIRARDAYDVILARYGISLRAHPKLKSALIDLFAFLPFLSYVASRKGVTLLKMAIRAIAREAGGFLVAANLGRNMAKRIGVHVLLTRLRRAPPLADFVICDEGILHLAHNLFVHANQRPDRAEIARFSSIVPKPDLVVWVRASNEHSIETILRNGHARAGRAMEDAEAFVEHACVAFDELFTCMSLQDRLLIIDNRRNGETSALSALESGAFAGADFLINANHNKLNP